MSLGTVAGGETLLLESNGNVKIDIDPNSVEGSSSFQIDVDTVPAVFIDRYRRFGVNTVNPHIIISTSLHIDDAAVNVRNDISEKYAHLIAQGDGGATLDLVHLGGGANDKWISLNVLSGMASFNSVLDNGSAYQASDILVMDLEVGHVEIGGNTELNNAMLTVARDSESNVTTSKTGFPYIFSKNWSATLEAGSEFYNFAGVGAYAGNTNVHVDLLASYQSDPTYGAAGHLRVTTNHPLNFWTNNTKRVTIAAAGNVGINETAPRVNLEVAGKIQVNDKLIFTQDDENEYIDSLNSGYIDYGATTSHRFTASGEVGKFERAVSVTNVINGCLILKVKTANNMVDGFGVGYRFDVEDDVSGNKYLAEIAAYRDGADGQGTVSIATSTTGANMLKRLYVRYNGNVGIGTATPGELLEVAGNIGIGNNNIYSGDASLADDVATSFTPGKLHGFIAIGCQTSCISALICYDCDGALSIQITAQSGTQFAVGTVALGSETTTGTDGKFNVNVYNGQIYLKNRLGGT